ncbi:MAG: hypothetical protein KF770_28805 [Anaerolineae bacterium]|nr:hypothetical protein [Anaerolineae bacterium]
MKWQDVRELFPDKWVLIEAIEAYTTEDRKRIVEQLSIISAATDFFEVMAMYKQINKHAPQRELFVVHTQNEELEITVRYRFLRITGPVTAVNASSAILSSVSVDKSAPTTGKVGLRRLSPADEGRLCCLLPRFESPGFLAVTGMTQLPTLCASAPRR